MLEIHKNPTRGVTVSTFRSALKYYKLLIKSSLYPEKCCFQIAFYM